MTDHECIWLQHPDDADPYLGRQWAHNKVWPNDIDDGEPTEYVRADLMNEARAQIAAKDAALQRIANATGTYVSVAIFTVNEAKAALTQPAPAQEDKP